MINLTKKDKLLNGVLGGLELQWTTDGAAKLLFASLLLVR